jgi:hypothetical protein
MTGDPPVTLESLDFEWGDAYLICYARDQWAALRRDTRQFLTAQTLGEMAARIDVDYAASPVPRDVDPPGTADYLDAPSADEDQDDAPDEDDGGAPGRDGDRPEPLIRQREAFPQWTISYAPFPGPGPPAKTAPPSARSPPRCCASRWR